MWSCLLVYGLDFNDRLNSEPDISAKPGLEWNLLRLMFGLKFINAFLFFN